MQSKNDVDELLNNYESETNQYKEAENRNKCFLEYCNKQIGDSITKVWTEHPHISENYIEAIYQDFPHENQIDS